MTEAEAVQQNPLATEKTGKLMAKFAIPCIISMLVNSLYNIVDQIFIGQGVGYLGNAATNVAFPLVTISMAFALLIGDGAAAYFSLKLGAGERENAAKGVGSAITMLAVVGVLFFAVGMIFLVPLLNIFGATEENRSYAIEYASIILIGLPFVSVSTGLNSLIRADGSPKFAMASMLSGAILNTILDPIFIFPLQMGVKGAAIATIIGQIVGFFISVCYLKRFKSIHFHLKRLKPDFHASKTLISFGVSSFITQMAITIVIVVMNNSLTYYGALSEYGANIPLAAQGIVMKVNQIVLSVMVGIAVGSQPIIGFNYGAKNYGRVRSTYRLAVLIACCFAAVAWLCFQLIPQSIVNIFGQEDALYNDFAVKCFRIFLLFVILNAFQTVSSIFFQAIGKPMRSALLSLSRQILFFIPAVLILPTIFGLDGALYAGPTADFLAFALAFVFILFEMKHLHRMEQEQAKLRVQEEVQAVEVE